MSSDHHERQGLARLVQEMTGQDVTACYQCGKCTAGCPMGRFLDLTTNQIMRLVQIGDDDATRRLLASTAIWRCAGCLTCTQRCPKQLDPAAVIDALRELSARRGVASREARRILAFHRAFLKTVRKTGRMSEFPLVRRYKLSSGDLFGDVGLAPLMLVKGKLPLKGHAIAGRDEVRRIFDACRQEEQEGQE